MGIVKHILENINFYERLRPEADAFWQIHDEKAWDNISLPLKEGCIKEAEKYLAFRYPAILAADYMEYFRNGNRSNFEALYFARRTAVCRLVIGEMLERNGRFLDDIINGIWLICEETTWVLPAHNGSDILGSADGNIDLFAAETGALLSFAIYLLNCRLPPQVISRVKAEIKRRILMPYIENDYWWMGFGEKKPMNWTTWCGMNCLTAFLIVEDDRHMLARGIDKIARSLDKFIDSYDEDGGCDEGVSYWERAGGCLFEALEALCGISTEVEAVFSNVKLRNIFTFPYKFNIEGDFYLNFADASARNQLSAGLLFRIGEKTCCDVLSRFGRYLHGLDGFRRKDLSGVNLCRQTVDLFALNRIVGLERVERIERPENVYLGGIEVMAARAGGMFLGAKGGNNNESHNHNDVGNFIVFKDGKPVFIDAGVETYTQKTFSDRRYEIWTMQSQYHNLPVISGQAQSDGAAYAATHTKCYFMEEYAEFSSDIAGAYGGGNIKALERRFRLFRGKNARIEIADAYELENHSGDTVYYFMCAREPVLLSCGHIVINGASLRYEPHMFSFAYEEILIDDSRLSPIWGDRIYRIALTLLIKRLSGRVSFVID